MKAPELPSDIAAAVHPVFDALPPDRAMDKLVVSMHGGSDELVKAVESAIEEPAFNDRPALCAGLWLYIDELDRSHRISQGIDDQTGSFWHAIMHRREGDFGNSRYWFHITGHHPVMDEIESYDAEDFLKRAQRAYDNGQNDDPELADLQREEWARLFEWCANQ